MSIEKYFKKGKDVVIELYDGVEYLVDDEAERAIKDGATQVMLVRLVDINDESVDLLAGNAKIKIYPDKPENINIDGKQYNISLVKIGVSKS